MKGICFRNVTRRARTAKMGAKRTDSSCSKLLVRFLADPDSRHPHRTFVPVNALTVLSTSQGAKVLIYEPETAKGANALSVSTSFFSS